MDCLPGEWRHPKISCGLLRESGMWRVSDTEKEQIWALESKLNNIANLVAALEVVSWQLAQSDVPDDVKPFRDAAIGISHALHVQTEGGHDGG